MHKILITNINHLENNEALSFEFVKDGQKSHGFVLLHNGKHYAYINRCPHTGINLEWLPNQFLDSNKQYIQCSTHGARFNIKDGLCIYGPCQGRSLEGIELVNIDDSLYMYLED